MAAAAVVPDAFVARVEALGWARMTVEAHLTVAAGTDRAAFEAACRELDVKTVTIELAAGATAVQPMTSKHYAGTFGDIARDLDADHAALRARGFDIVRVKLETSAMAADEPVLGGYYEFHVEVGAATAAEIAAVSAIARARGAHLSRSARRDHVRFATLRVYGEPRASADARANGLIDALIAGGHVVVGCERELTIYDSRVELDAGWLEPPP